MLFSISAISIHEMICNQNFVSSLKETGKLINRGHYSSKDFFETLAKTIIISPYVIIDERKKKTKQRVNYYLI